MKTAKLSIAFGAMSRPICTQVLDQTGKVLPQKIAEKVQRAADAVTFLSVHGFMADSTTGKIRKRITQLITESIQ